jgi:Endonuclease/Exonuclease/phosphatase family
MAVRRAARDTRSPALLALASMLAASLLIAPAVEAQSPPDPVRFATFNASLNRGAAGVALSDLSAPFDPAEPDPVLRIRRNQAANVAEVIQRVRPEVLLVNEFDYVDGPIDGNAMTDAFQANYLGVAQNVGGPGGATQPITYPYVFVAPSNTGIASGFDLNNNGAIVTTPGEFGYGDDALGFGNFPGQFGMAVFSQHPIDYDAARTFQHFLWRDMPAAMLPDLAGTPALADWYSPEELAVLPLSSKSHWDVPVDIGGTTVHFLVSHPTPPVFDGGEDRNGKRNFDEIRFWADFITPGAGGYIYDDAGGVGGLKPGEKFVIAGDQNSDPLDGDSVEGAIQQLIEHPRVNTTVTPRSDGAVEASALQGGANLLHLGDPQFDTADFADGAPGNLRADYVLPSRNLRIVDAAVFWPVQASPLFRLTGVFDPAWLPVGGFPTSDHRLVWVDVSVPGSARNE